ncbi:MAG: signal peptidase I [Ilumatobacter sp.]
MSDVAPSRASELPPPPTPATTPPPPPPPAASRAPNERSHTARWIERGALCIASIVVLAAMLTLVGAAQGYRPVVLETGSMGDAAPAGSLLITSPRSADDIAVGDVLVMRHDRDVPVTHRVIELLDTDVGTVARTQGDANEFADAVPYALSNDELVARWIIPGAGSWLEQLRQPAVWLALIALLIAAISAVALRRIWISPAATESERHAADTGGRGLPRITRTRLALAGVIVASLVGAGLVYSLFTSGAEVASNQFGSSACFSPEVASVQTGTTTLTADGTTTETITAVAPTRSFVTATVSSDSVEVADSSAQVVLTGPTTLDVTRATDSGAPPTVTVAWSVVEYVCGISVQRGVAIGNGTNALDVTVAPAATTSSFVLLNTLAPGTATTFGPNDLARAQLTTSTNLAITGSSTSVFTPARSFAWQVVSFDDPDDAAVQSATGSFGTGDTTKDLTLSTPIDPRSTFITAWATSDSSGTDVSDRMIRAVLVDGSTVRVDRSSSGTSVDVFVQVVTLDAGATVQHGTLDMASAVSVSTSPIDPVDASRTSVMSTVGTPGPTAGGMTDHISDATIGEATATFTLSGIDQVQLARSSSGSTASFGWQVIEWSGPGWWDVAYGYRQRIDVAAGTATPEGYTVPVTIDHAELVGQSLSQADGDDLRVLRWDGVSWLELDRILDDAASWNASATTFLFRTTDAVTASTTATYWLYLDNPTATAPPSDPENVFLLVEDFDDGTLGEFDDRTGGTGWYTADPWTRRIDITIPAGRTASDLTDFSLLVSLTSAELATYAQPDGSDIRFTLADASTTLAHDLEQYVSGTGSITAWVQVPLLTAATPTTISMLFGAADAPAQERPAEVWPATSGAVWHLDRDPAGSAPQLDDVSRSNQDGLSLGSMTTSDLVSGLIGDAIEFDGVDDALVALGAPLDAAAAVTASAWIRPNTLASDMVVLDNAADAANRALQLDITSTGAVRVTFESEASTIITTTGAAAVTTGTWQHVAARWDGSSLDVLIDGTVSATTPAPGSPADLGGLPVHIGDAVDAGSAFDGSIDDVRFELVERSNDWLAASVANQAAPGAFSSQGAPTTVSLFGHGTWSSRKPISIDSDRIDADLNDFALLVETTEPRVQATAQACGCDIVFTAGDGVTRLDHVVEDYDATTGALTAWVRVPLVSSTVDTELFLYYANPTASDQQDPVGVFGPDADLQILGST